MSAQATAAPGEFQQTQTAPTASSLTAAQVFALADQARTQKDYDTAKAAYRALFDDPNPEIVIEARFRLGMMLADELGQYDEAAVQFRRILDTKPNAARVRLELSRMHAMLGDLGAARRELRAAEAAGIPPEVEQLVHFYSRALNASKPFGGSLELSLAPDSNINRATRSDTLGTVIGDFTLDDDAKARSGTGLDIQTQAYLRLPVATGLEVLTRASTSSTFYRDADFNDIIVNVQAGPQYTWGSNRFTLGFGPTWRWYGGEPLSAQIGGNASWQRPVGKRGQIRVEASAGRQTNKRNDLQSGGIYTISSTFDRAFSARLGGGLRIYGLRDAAHDPGYATTSGGASVYLFREFGQTTLVGTFGYSRLEADERLFLYPERRMEDRYSASIASTLRALRLGRFSPLVRVNWERNVSSISIYDYGRVSAEFGITSAF